MQWQTFLALAALICVVLCTSVWTAGGEPEAKPGAHPRLFLSRDQLPEFRKKAQTPEGRAIVANLRELLKKKVPMEQVQSGETRLAGLWAAGQATLYAVTGEKADADKTRDLVDSLVSMPVVAMPELRRGTRYMGIAIAYDLCHDAWDEAFRKKVATYLEARADGLLTRKEGVKGDNPTIHSNHNVEGRTQMGVIALAISGDRGVTPAVEKIIDAARKDLDGWAARALGDHGWGTEGDGFTINCLNWGVYQFATAYQNVCGRPATTAEGFAWVLPLLMTRVVGADMPYFGPEVCKWDGCDSFGASFYVLGLDTVAKQMRPAVKAFYDEHFGLRSKAPFKMGNPAEALYLLAYYPFGLEAKPLGEVLPLSVQDRRKGIFVFRNAYRGEDDCLTVAYLHSEFLRAAWRSKPGVRVWGLGRHWLSFDPTHTEDADKTAGVKATHYAAWPDGSGVFSAPVGKGTFSLAVDYSGACGSPVLIAFCDHSGQALTLDTKAKAAVDGRSFTLAGGKGVTLKGMLVAAGNGNIRAEGEKLTLPAGAFVVATIQNGAAPAVQIDGEGVGAKVTAGKQTIWFDGKKIVLGILAP